jgi:hypothetical protein
MLLLLLTAIVAQSDFCRKSGANQATGQQQPNGGQLCSDTEQGLIPDVDNMVSTMIELPESGANVDASQGFSVTFSTTGLISGNMANMDKNFLQSPQNLQNGKIEGFQQISIQAIENPQRAPAAVNPSFFQALNTPSGNDGRTKFTVQIAPGQIKTTGLHRICTMAASSTGQPVIMPVAQRGAQDDCIRVNIVNGGANFQRKR